MDFIGSQRRLRMEKNRLFMTSTHQYLIHEDGPTMAEAATSYFVDLCKTVIAEKGKCAVCLSGGSTPKRMFKLLASDTWNNKIEWSKLFIFWGDERSVGQDSPDSNSGEAMRLLFDQVDIPKENIFAINGALDPTTAAEDYETTLETFFGDHEPVFDLCFLGMGDDGHTASLFPYTEILYEDEYWVKEVFVEKLDTTRISLTPEIINQAARIVFLIGGKNKADVLQEVITGDFNPEKLPSQLVIRSGADITFFLDEGAASELDLG